MITVCTTTAAYRIMKDEGYWSSWMSNAEAIKRSVGDEVRYFAALEVDARGLAPLKPFVDRLKAIGGEYWTFSLDDGSREVNTQNRLVRITTGQNLCNHYSMEAGASHMMFLASDTRVPDSALSELMAMGTGICGLNCPTYCQDGPSARYREWPSLPWPKEWDVREHMQSAAMLLIRRDVFTRVRWRIDIDKGMTDDPCYHADCLALGHPTFVRHDLECRHYPECIGPVETRAGDRTLHHEERI